jgi:histidine triad (HIT) family protein
MPEDCIFCKIVKGEIPCDKVYEDDNFIGFLDIKPKASGHTLIIPKKHYKTLLDMPSTMGVEMVDAIKEVALNLIREKKAEGYNIIVNGDKAGGQLVMHLHVHIIPRKDGDGLKSLV